MDSEIFHKQLVVPPSEYVGNFDKMPQEVAKNIHDKKLQEVDRLFVGEFNTSRKNLLKHYYLIHRQDKDCWGLNMNLQHNPNGGYCLKQQMNIGLLHGSKYNYLCHQMYYEWFRYYYTTMH